MRRSGTGLQETGFEAELGARIQPGEPFRSGRGKLLLQPLGQTKDLLDWEGDLYGDRLVLELWRKLRDERAFESEADLVAQIARDVEETRAATRPG